MGILWQMHINYKLGKTIYLIMISKKNLSTKYSLDTLETDVSILDPELYRSTIASIIAEIRTKYNGPQLKQLVVNIHRLQEYNMYKLARCNKQLERQASFSFKFTEIQNLLEKYNISFLKVLEDSPDYRLDDLYRKFVHINHKLSQLDPDHMRIFGGNITERTGAPGSKIIKSNERLKAQRDKGKAQNDKLILIIESMQAQNDDLKRQIEAARINTESAINQLMKFKGIEKEYQDQYQSIEFQYVALQKQLQAKQQMLRQKDELAEHYKNSIEKLKLSLLTPTKFTKPNKQKQIQLAQKIESTVQTAIKKAFQTSREPLRFGRYEEPQSFSPQFRSQKGIRTPKGIKIPPKSPSIAKQMMKQNGEGDLWRMLLVQCVSLQSMLQPGDE